MDKLQNSVYIPMSTENLWLPAMMQMNLPGVGIGKKKKKARHRSIHRILYGFICTKFQNRQPLRQRQRSQWGLFLEGGTN